MKKIYVLDENGQLQEIDAGVTDYKELENVPISMEALTEEPMTDEELIKFATEDAEPGRYDINCSAGREILLIDDSDEKQGRRIRRIGVDQDRIWDTTARTWLTITDTTAKELVYQVLSDTPTSIAVGDPLRLSFYYYSTIGRGAFNATINGVDYTLGTAESGDTVTFDISK